MEDGPRPTEAKSDSPNNIEIGTRYRGDSSGGLRSNRPMGRDSSARLSET